MTANKARTPYDAEHVAIVDMGRTVLALYIPDPEQAKDPRAVADNITAPEYADVEVVATATRCYQTEGATASGWFIRSGLDSGSEGYPNKGAMREALNLTISGYFSTTEQETTVAETPRPCSTHKVADERGAHTEALPLPHCEPGTAYGVWDDLAGGFTFAADCAMEVANWAAEQLDQDPDGEMTIKAVCREHQEQPADSCEDCDAEPDDEDEERDTDEAFRLSFREVSHPSPSGRPTYERFA